MMLKNFQTRHFVICMHVEHMILAKIVNINKTQQ